PGGQRRLDGGDAVGGLGAVGGAALGEVGLAARALAAHGADRRARQGGGVEAADEIGGQGDGDRGLAVVHRRVGDDAAFAEALAGLVNERAHVLGRDAFDHAAVELDAADVLGGGRSAAGAAAEGELLARLGE